MQLLNATLQIFISIITPVMILLMILGLVAGVIKVSTQIEDRSFGFAIKFFILFVVFYLFSDNWGGSVAEFAKQIWGNIEYYRPVI
jgi:type III secretory pathway component EscS